MQATLIELLLFVLVGFILGGLVAYWFLNSKNKNQEDNQENLEKLFENISQKVLASNNKIFLENTQSLLQQDSSHKNNLLAEIIKPLKEALDKVDNKVNFLEKSREGQHQALSQEIKSLLVQTEKLSKSLYAPTIRGKWGEIQLKRVVELAGMTEHCDFVEQGEFKNTETGARLRPDLIVNLPKNKKIIIDAKAPLSHIAQAHDAKSQEEKLELLKLHALGIKKHIGQLSKKDYFKNLDNNLKNIDFVVLFLPAESFFGAALSLSPEIIEEGLKQNVIVATPTTLIALLRTVSLGWRQENLAENAQKISQLGAQLYDRVSKMGEHYAKVGKALGQSVEAYNQTLGTLEKRVLKSARDLGALCGQKEKLIADESRVEEPIREPKLF